MYIIEGNIGAGKTTFLKLICQNLPNISVALEPVANWSNNINGESLLNNFYEDPKRWAFSMEFATLMHRMKDYTLEQNRNNIILMERSIYSGFYCFAYNGYKSGFLTKLEWSIYKEWFDFLAQKCKRPTGFIYLKIDPEIAFERIKKRSRDGESSISLSYLKDLQKRYEDFLISKRNICQSLVDTPVLTLDCNQEFEVDKNLMQNFCTKVSDFIEHGKNDVYQF